MNRLIFRSFDGTLMRYDVTGFEHGTENEMSGVFLDGTYYKIVEKIDPQEGDMHPSAIVEQFTGLHDKNGVKIFEGDILKRETQGPGVALPGYKPTIEYAVMEFHTEDIGSCGCCYPEFHGSGFKAGGFAPQYCEVAGNIHKNPELLEKK